VNIIESFFSHVLCFMLTASAFIITLKCWLVGTMINDD